MEVVECEVDIVFVVISGIVGFVLIYVVLKLGRWIVLVNKESFVCVGDVFMVDVCCFNVEIMLVDFEYNVLEYVLVVGFNCDVEKVIIIVLGGLFWIWL